MNSDSSRKSLLVILSVALIIACGTFLLSILARGYRLDLSQGLKLKVTGLLSVTSKPKSASVYLNNLLTTATDDTLNLNPGSYQLKISKEAYFPWEKTIQIQPELVYQADAQLFRLEPDLLALTQGQVINPVLSPDSSKIIYAFATSSATSKENGLYLLELSELPLLMSKSSQRLLSLSTPILDWSKFTFEFSPNSRQILATSKNISYLFSLDQKIDSAHLFDVSATLPKIRQDWQNSKQELTDNLVNKIPLELRHLVATDSAVLAFNSNNDKLLYQASSSALLPERQLNPSPVRSTQIQHRQLQSGSYYVYDLKEDTNFLIGDTSFAHLAWVPYTNNLLYSQKTKLNVVEYDATNTHTLFQSFQNPQIILPTPDGFRLILCAISTSKSPLNLYSLTIRDRN